jgi:hypothetical protein
MADRNRFGLPVSPADHETAQARAYRKAETRWHGELALNELFSRLANNLGKAEAARLFEDCITRFVGDRKRSSSNPARDDFFLQAYEAGVRSAGSDEKALAEVPRKTAKRLYRLQQEEMSHVCPGAYGNSVEAIEKQIRRLLKEQAKTQSR